MADVKRIISPDTQRKNRVPPGQRVLNSFPVFHLGVVPRIDPAEWRLALFGAVAEPRELTWDELSALPTVEVYADVHCVTSWSKLGNTFTGVAPSSLQEVVDIGPEARYVMIHSADDYTANLALEDFFQPDAILAFGVDGEPLDAEHGGPVRVVVPRLYYWKSAKWVIGLEFMTTDRPGYWESRGYHNHGDPWTEERYG